MGKLNSTLACALLFPQSSSKMPRRCLFALATLAVLGMVSDARAEGIQAGFDLYSVIPGSTRIDLSSLFPGAGTVFSDGVPVLPGPDGLGNTTTAIERTGGLPVLPVGATGTVPIELFAENSVSVTPVDRSLFGLGVGLADFHTIINRGGLLPGLPNTDGLVGPSDGFMSITRTGINGGTFALHLDVNPLIVFTTVGGSVSDLNAPDVLRVVDGTGLLNPVGSVGGQWSFSAPPNVVVNSAFPAGGFYAATDPDTGARIDVHLTSGGIPAARAITLSAVPEPSTLTLFVIGGLIGLFVAAAQRI